MLKYKSLGNHEFDNGVSGLTPFIQNLTTPVLAANLKLNNVPELAAQANLRKSVVFNVSDVAVGVIGYLTPETKVLAVHNNVEYIDEIVALRDEVKNLKNEGVNIIIALGHSGYLRDLEIAKAVDGIDLVIGGHSNTFLWNGTTPDSDEIQGPYPTYVTQASGKQVPVVQAYAYTKYLGKLHMIFNSNGDVTSIDGNPILLDNRIPQDPELLQIVERYRRDILNITEEVLGQTSVVLDGLSCQNKECNLGNLIADAMIYRYATDYKGKYWTDAPIATIQGGGIRSSIANTKAPTNITKGDLLGVMPFEGILVTAEMNGTILLQMLEYGVSNYDPLDYPGEFLQVSGIRVVFDLRRPSGSRILKAEARCGLCDIPSYSEIKPDQTYKIIMPNFLAQGGDGYWMFKGLSPQQLNYNEHAATVFYVTHHSHIYHGEEGRVILIDGNEANLSIRNTPSLFILTCCLGNHEFDEDVDGVVPFIKNLTTPVLAANLILDKVPELQNITNLYKSIIILKKGVKIGIIGYLTPDTKFLAPKNNVDYEDEIPAIRREVNKLREKGVNIIIALGHSGFLKDIEIAKEVNGLDLVIGGHSNTFLWNGNNFKESPEHPQGLYPTMIKQSSGRIVPVVQAYAYTKYLGKLHLVFDSSGEVLKCFGDPILLHQEIPNDEEVLAIIKRYRGDIDRINNEIIGSSLIFLDGEQCRLRECNLGNLITDATLNYTKRTNNKYTDVNIVFIQGGRIRSSLERSEIPFNVTRGDFITVLPFSDTLSVVTMNGSILIQALEHSVASWRTIDSPGQFLQLTGVEVTYDLSKEPGGRVKMVKAICTDCVVLDDVRDYLTYKVIMPGFLADGGDGYNIFEKLPKEILSYNELTCTLDYLKRYSPINPVQTGHIIVLNEDVIIENVSRIAFNNEIENSRSNVNHINVFLLATMCIFYVYT